METVLVTGAASGIGKAASKRFVQEGFRVFGTSRRRRPDGAGVEMLELDVRSDASVERCATEVLDRAGRIDVLVNNAGAPCLGVVEEISLDEARDLFETNVFGPIRMARAVLPSMRQHRRGRIINVGSLSAWVGEPGDGLYSASKHALAGVTEALRHEVWPFGIHVSLVEPGEFRTGFLDASSTPAGAIADYDVLRQAVMRTFNKALQTGGDPSRVGRLIVKIAQRRSPRLRYVVGRGAYLPYLKVLLPQPLFDVLIRKGFGLTKTS